jgi:cobalt/nickel transport system permease protein
MAGNHVHALYQHGDSRVHRLAPHAKIMGTALFVFAVVATPREAFWAFALYAIIVAVLIRTARLPRRFVASRMLIEVPFLVAAALLPFAAGGDRVDVAGLSLSVSGLWGLWNIVAKATLGLLASIVLAGTTQVSSLLAGLDALRTPRIVTGIMGFMVRYLDVVLGEFRRMRVAMRARGFAPAWFGHARPYATAAGTLFVRSYERGERVYLAMASRGYAGSMPAGARAEATAGQWVGALSPGVVAWVVAVAAWALR